MARGGAAAIIRNRRIPPFTGRRRGQGVITGLAARRPGTIARRAGTLNRAALNQVQQTGVLPSVSIFFSGFKLTIIMLAILH